MRRTLVDLLARDIANDDESGPDWPSVVEDAVLRQDMEWVEATLVVGIGQAEHRAEHQPTQAAQQR
jgi:hypothetical protein